MRWLYVAFFFAAASVLLPPVGGLPPEAVRAIGVLAAAIVLWLSGAIPVGLTGVLVIIALPLVGVIPFSESVKGFGTTTAAFLASILIVAQGVQQAGLGRRLTGVVGRISGGEPRLVLLTLLMITYGLVFLVPTPIGRLALMLPIAREIIAAGGKDRNLGAAVLVGLVYTVLLSAPTTMTGASGMVYSVGLYAEMLDYHWTYPRWTMAFLPITLPGELAVWAILVYLFPVRKVKRLAIESDMPPLSSEEKRVGAILILMLLAWFTEEIHGYPVAMVGMVAAAAMLMPGTGILDWSKAIRRLNLDSILIFGAGLALASAMTRSGLDRVAASFIHSHTAGLSPAFIGLTVVIIFMVLRIGFTTMTALLASMLPVVFALADRAGLNPVWLGMVGVMSSMLSLYFPNQSTAAVLAFSEGFFEARDLLKAGLLVAPVIVILILVVSVYYWPLLGISY